jgi:predicted GIY-YIG superfamily endonuclease
MSDPVYLYRWYSSDGSLLYIGVARDPRTRGHHHLRNAEWARWAHRIDIQEPPYESDAAAKAAEKMAIQLEEPLFNRRYGRGGYGSGPETSHLPLAAWSRPSDLLGAYLPIPARSNRVIRVLALDVACPGCG